MKGIILAGGNGRRLSPITDVTNKHLLPIYDKPMIFYPLATLLDAGIKDILVVTGKEYAGGFIKLLGSGRKFNCRFTFEVQEDASGIAHALGLAAEYVGGDSAAVILGDNMYEDSFAQEIQQFSSGAHIFLKHVPDAYRFGVAHVQDGLILGIEEKPKSITAGDAVTGLYLYDSRVFEIIKTLKPSGRGELEITDVNNAYIDSGEMKYSYVKGNWTDAGTFESMYRATVIARDLVLMGKASPFDRMYPNRTHQGIANGEESQLSKLSQLL